MFLAMLLPLGAYAANVEPVTNDASIPASSAGSDNAETSSSGVWDFLVGQAPEDAVNFGMVTWHFNPESRKNDRWNNLSLAATYNSIFIGTLLNSFSDRAFVLGVQRNVWEADSKGSDWNMNVGYRLGVITGYDQRMSSTFARYSPVLPFPQIYTQFAYKDFGVEFSWVAVVFTAQLFYRF